MKWQKQLKEHKAADWFIVHVVYQDNLKSGKSKIQLPRSSVYDKIKTEFGQKSQDRYVMLKTCIQNSQRNRYIYKHVALRTT